MVRLTRGCVLVFLALGLVATQAPSASSFEQPICVETGREPICVDPETLNCEGLADILREAGIADVVPCPDDTDPGAPTFAVFVLAAGGLIACEAPSPTPCTIIPPTIGVEGDVWVTGACWGKTHHVHPGGGGSQVVVKANLDCTRAQQHLEIRTYLIRGSTAVAEDFSWCNHCSSAPQTRAAVDCPQPGGYYYGYSFYTVAPKAGTYFYGRDRSENRQYIDC